MEAEYDVHVLVLPDGAALGVLGPQVTPLLLVDLQPRRKKKGKKN